MKKQLLFMAFMALFAMTFTACSSDDLSEKLQAKGKALTLDASILQAQPMEMSTRAVRFYTDPIYADVMHSSEEAVSTSELSRAPLDDAPTWAGGEAITMKVTDPSGTSYHDYTIGASGANSTLTSAEPYYFVTTSNVTASVWFPSSSKADKTTHEVNGNQSTDANFKNSDFMYGSGTFSHNGLSNSISMAHKIAKVKITVNVNNASYLSNSTVNSVSLSGTKRTADVGSNGTLSANGTASAITMHKNSNVYEACIIPQSATPTLTINVGGTTYTASFTPQTFAANTVYTGTVNINAERVLYLGGSSVAVGDYYCKAANGQAFVVKRANLATANSKGIKPIAVVFSTSTSTTDKGHGWNLGYAMALQCATTGSGANGTCTWGPANTDSPVPNATGDYTTWQTNYDGYTETWKIGENSSYPAFYYAIRYKNTVAAPPASSNWYLPSNGQWLAIEKNLGGMTTAYTATVYDTDNSDGYIGNWVRWDSRDRDDGIMYSTNAQNAINIYLNAASSYASIYTIDWSAHMLLSFGEYFWCSSEWNANMSFHAYFSKYSIVRVNSDTDDTKLLQFRVRPVLAF